MSLCKYYLEVAEVDHKVRLGGKRPTLKNILESNREYFDKPPPKITSVGSDAKTVKGKKVDVVTAIVYLPQDTMISKKTNCAFAHLAGCSEDCLIGAGRLGMRHATLAIIRRGLFFMYKREQFDLQLQAEIMQLSLRHGDKLAVRLNGTSDIDFSYMIEKFPEVQFYDYTKILNRVSKNKLENYDLTYSFSPYSKKSLEHGYQAIKDKRKVALAFNTKGSKGDTLQIPDTLFSGKKLVSFDDTDARFLDKKGSIGFLTRKGSSVKERQRENQIAESFFVTESNIKFLK